MIEVAAADAPASLTVETLQMRVAGRIVRSPPVEVDKYTTALHPAAPLFSRKARTWMVSPAPTVVVARVAPPLLSSTSTVVPE